MITIYPYESLGHADHGWLDARHHFSFARYYRPDRMGFGALRVINDDTIAAGKGFEPHPHRNMEIITYVRQGAITHRDSMNNEGRTAAGDVQVMSAGTGVTHSEYNLEDETTRLFQIWIEPAKQDVTPYWDSAQFPKDFSKDSLPILVSGRNEDLKQGALPIHQDAAIAGGRLAKGQDITQPIKHQAYVLVSNGSISLNGYAMGEGDGAEVVGETRLTIRAETEAELVIIDVPDVTH